jgi:hypothetical protein
MGSGTNRSWWKKFGSRSGRRAGTKSRNPLLKPTRLRMKGRRAEARRRSNP